MTVLLFLDLLSCSIAEKPWDDVPNTRGHCFSVNLADGLENTEEIRQLFECANESNNFDAFQGIVNSLDVEDREGITVGENFIIILDFLNTESNVWDMAKSALTWIEQSESYLQPTLEIALELIYGNTIDTIPENLSAVEQILESFCLFNR